MKSLNLFVVAILLLLAGCVTVPVDATGQPIVERSEAVVLDPVIKDKAGIALDIWCGNLPNVRRIVLRFIHAIDPEWRSVCANR